MDAAQQYICRLLDLALNEVHQSEIVECLAITGDGDFQLRIVACDLASFSRFLMEVVIPMPGVATTRSHIVLDQVKSTTALPIGASRPAS